MEIGQPGVNLKVLPCKNHPDRPVLIDKNGRSMGVCLYCIQQRVKNRKNPRVRKFLRPPSKEVAKDKVHKVRKERKKDGKHKVVLDFTNHKEIFDKVVEKAKKEFRTVENQILFYLNTI